MAPAVPGIRRFTTAEAAPGLLSEIRALLDTAFAGAFSDDDWDHACGGWHVTVTDGPALVAHAAVVPRTLEVGAWAVPTGYVEEVATTPGRQGEGLGSLAMTEVAAIVQDGGFAMGALSTGRHGFYERLGWERWQGPTFVREGGERRRTEEEDDGIMVLRFGLTGAVDVRQPLTCAARGGDDW